MVKIQLTSAQKKSLREEIILCRSVKKDLIKLNGYAKGRVISLNTIGVIASINSLWRTVDHYGQELEKSIKPKKRK